MARKKDGARMQQSRIRWKQAYEDYITGAYSYQELADKYGVTVATIKSWYTRHWKPLELLRRDKKVKRDNTNAIDEQNKLNDEFNTYSTDNLPTLAHQEEQFVKEYLEYNNAGSAAIRAGYPIATAEQQGNRLLADPKIVAWIESGIAERQRRTGLTPERVMTELARIILANPGRVMDMQTGELLPDASEDDYAAIQNIKVQSTFTDDGQPSRTVEVRYFNKMDAIKKCIDVMGLKFKVNQPPVKGKHFTGNHETVKAIQPTDNHSPLDGLTDGEIYNLLHQQMDISKSIDEDIDCVLVEDNKGKNDNDVNKHDG